MSVFLALGEEHELLRMFVGRLERGAADSDERTAERETRGGLLILLRALEAHEALEDMLFERFLEPPSPDARTALALVEGQHRLLAALREEGLALLRDGPNEGCGSMRGLVQRLARLLRRHFEDEERDLWPKFNALATRSTLNRLDRLARAQVREMQRDLERYGAEVADYLTGDR
ncbi:MAG: hemerythrin domain-containing protein [Elusimicrobiota bacterium]